MKKEAASAGVLDTPFGKFARLQILTIEDLFAGKKPTMPPEDPAAFRKAAREEDKTRQAKLLQPNSPHFAEAACLWPRVTGLGYAQPASQQTGRLADYPSRISKAIGPLFR